MYKVRTQLFVRDKVRTLKFVWYKVRMENIRNDKSSYGKSSYANVRANVRQG